MSAGPNSIKLAAQTIGRVPRLISFSGIDGAGKSTQIDRLCARFNREGFSFRLVSFWDDVATFAHLRDEAGHAVFGGDRGVGSPAAPINRRDKNVQSWTMTCVRLGIYFADAISLRLLIRRARRWRVDILVFDRFIYDELANLPSRNTFVRAYIRAIARFAPRPNVRFLLDADPVAARARKPEYPIEFLRANRKSYLDLDQLIGSFSVIAPTSIEDAERQVARHALQGLAPDIDAQREAEQNQDRLKHAPEFDPPQSESLSF